MFNPHCQILFHQFPALLFGSRSPENHFTPFSFILQIIRINTIIHFGYSMLNKILIELNVCGNKLNQIAYLDYF